MATSKVAIANGALQRLGAKRIESITADVANARTMNAAFDRVRRQLLRKYDWSFAIARDSIAADADGPEWGDWDRYGLPNGFIRLIRDDESGQQVDFRIEGQFILSRAGAPLEIRFVQDVIDPNEYDDLFIEAFECALALVTCKEVTGNTAMKESLKDDFDTAIAEAKKAGAIEKGAQNFPEDDWVNARL